MMPYRFVPMLLFLILATWVGQDFARDWVSAPDGQGQLTGAPAVIDGDTILLGGVRLRLDGIDAPELGQPALTPAGLRVDAGAIARAALVDAIAGDVIACAWTAVDRHGRPLARCRLSDGRDLNALMVTRGAAFAYWEGRFPLVKPGSLEYAVRAFLAALRDEGLHAFEIASPSAYRAAQRRLNGVGA